MSNWVFSSVGPLLILQLIQPIILKMLMIQKSSFQNFKFEKVQIVQIFFIFFIFVYSPLPSTNIEVFLRTKSLYCDILTLNLIGVNFCSIQTDMENVNHFATAGFKNNLLTQKRIKCDKNNWPENSELKYISLALTAWEL